MPTKSGAGPAGIELSIEEKDENEGNLVEEITHSTSSAETQKETEKSEKLKEWLNTPTKDLLGDNVENREEKIRTQREREEEEDKLMAAKLKKFEEDEDKEIGYEGEHPADEIGTFRWVSGNVYVGELKYGLKHGKGTFNWASGACYEGDWKYDKRNGVGMYKSANSDLWVYEGEFQDDRYNGRGTYRWPDGRVYEGMWKDDKQHGYGVVCSPDGKV